jgi:hypothetical protein
MTPSRHLLDFYQLSLSPDWFRKDEENIYAMRLDISFAFERALKDAKYCSVANDNNGYITATVFFPSKVENIGSVENLFYIVWGNISFSYSFIKREFTETNIIYYWITSTKDSAYHGQFIFTGENIEKFLTAYRKQ